MINLYVGQRRIKLQVNLEGDIVQVPRFDKIRKFNLYYLAFVSFVVGYGRIFSSGWMSFGKHPENILPIPILLTLYLIIYERGYKWPITYREKVFAAYAFFISLMPFWGLYLDASLNALKEFWAAAIFGILILYNVREEKNIRLLVFSFLFGILFKSILYNFDFLITSDRMRTLFVQKYGAADFLLAPIAICLGLFFYWANGFIRKTLLLVIFLIFSFSIIKADCRGTLVALPLAITLFYIIFNKKFTYLIILITSIIAFSVYFSPNSPLSRMLSSIKWNDEALQIRIQKVFPAAIAIYKDHNPIWGIGWGSFVKIASSTPKYNLMDDNLAATHSHNLILQALVTQGVLGLSMYLFFIFQIIFMSSYILKSSTFPFTKAMGAAGFLWIIALAAAGLVNHEFHNSRFNMGVGLMISVTVISYYILISEKIIEYHEGTKLG